MKHTDPYIPHAFNQGSGYNLHLLDPKLLNDLVTNNSGILADGTLMPRLIKSYDYDR